MPMIRAMRLLNAVEAGTTSGAQLQTLLAADPGRLAEFNVLLGMRGQMRRMAASSTAMAAVAASSTAMAAVIASSTAMTAVAASSTARAAIYNSDTALNAIAASATAIAAIAASAAYQTKVNINSTNTATSIGFTGPAIIIKLSQSSSASAVQNMVIGSLRAGTAISGTKDCGPAPGTYNATASVPGNTWVLPAQATATQSNTAGSIGSVLNIGFIYV